MTLTTVIFLKLCIYTVFTPLIDSKEFKNSADISCFSAEERFFFIDIIEAETEENKDDSEQESDTAFLHFNTFWANDKSQLKFYFGNVNEKCFSKRTVLRYLLYCSWLE
jgi:hypothetical protein